MSGKGSGMSVTSQGTNGQGPTYTNYSDGAYSYNNPSGPHYYNTGKGHGFYNNGSSSNKSSDGQQYSTHYNYNQSYSNSEYLAHDSFLGAGRAVETCKDMEQMFPSCPPAA